MFTIKVSIDSSRRKNKILLNKLKIFCMVRGQKIPLMLQ